MNSEYIQEFQEALAVFDEKQKDLAQRMEDCMEEHKDHLDYLRERAFERQLRTNPHFTITDFQDINKFLGLFGLKDIHDVEDRMEQPFIIAFFYQYQAFVEESREMRRVMQVAKIKMSKGNIEFLFDLIEKRKKDLIYEGMIAENEEIQATMDELMVNSRIFIADVMKDIAHHQKN